MTVPASAGFWSSGVSSTRYRSMPETAAEEAASEEAAVLSDALSAWTDSVRQEKAVRRAGTGPTRAPARVRAIPRPQTVRASITAAAPSAAQPVPEPARPAGVSR